MADQEPVTVSLVLGPVDDAVAAWTPTMPRWLARDVLRDFAAGIEWDGRPVLRALIVDTPA